MKKFSALKVFAMVTCLFGYFFPSNGFALIGESMDQSDTRYGPAIKTIGDRIYYRKAGLDITVHFYNGFSDNITYKKFDRDKQGRRESMTFEEIAILLDNNSRGHEWKDLVKGYNPNYQPKTMWECKKYHLHAYYDDENRTLDIFAKNYAALSEIYSRGAKVNHEKLLNTLGL